MSPRRAGFALLLALVAWPAAPARAWNDATRTRMIHDALKVSPPALRAILGRHERDLGRGMLAPSAHEGEEVHFQNADDPHGLAIDAAIQKEGEIRALLAARRSFRRVAFEMGVLAHLVSDIAFPLNASDRDPREPLYREAYRNYVGAMLDKIPFVLERIPSEEAIKEDLRVTLLAMARRAGRNYALIGPAFKDDGTARSAEALDERSVPFGIASLSYSAAVNGILQVWMHLWSSVDGDMQGTFAMTMPPPQAATLPVRPARRGKSPAAAGTPAPAGASSPSPAGAASPTPSAATPAPAAGPPSAPAVPAPSPAPTPKAGRLP